MRRNDATTISGIWMACAAGAAACLAAIATPQAQSQVNRHGAAPAHHGTRVEMPPPPVVPDIKTPAVPVVKQPTPPSRLAAQTQPANRNADEQPAAGKDHVPNEMLNITLRQPLFDMVDGSLWVRGQTYKAQFNAEGFTYIPFLGASAPQNYPVQFTVQSIRVGEQALNIPAAQPVRDGNQVIFHRGPVQEIYHIALHSVEQTFVLNERPASNGPITIELAIHSDLTASETAEAIQFSTERGTVNYTKAILVDASEARTNLATQLQSNTIRITVPQTLLAEAAFPIVIDPVVSTFTAYDVDQDNRWPDVAQDATADGYLVVWENQFSASDGDVFSRRFGFGGAPLDTDPITIDFTGSNWRRPKVANNNNGNNYLVVAERGAAPSRIIWGRTRQSANTTTSAQFQIGDPAAFPGDQFSADVGGDPFDGTPSYFLVTWSREFSAVDHDVHARLVNTNATTQGGIILIDNSVSHDITPRISKSNGAENWRVVWAREFSATDYDIYARDITWGGSNATDTYSVDSSGVDNRNPTASSPLDVDVVGQPRRYMIVYEEAPGAASDIYARVYRGTTLITEGNLTLLENVATASARRRPVVDSTTNSRFVVASEQQFSGGDWDIYVSQYCLAGTTLRVAEQHRNLGYTSFAEGQLNLAGVHNSGGDFSNEFMIVSSTVSTTTSFGSIQGARYNAKNSCCIADVTGDNQINVNDLLTVINQWSSFCLDCEGDVHGDLAVNVNDLLAVINAWGGCP